jgi:hypothetical protein
MDWFFQQWVYGTELPHYASDLAVKPDGNAWRITGTIKQEGVSPTFRVLVPIYVEFDKGEKARVGMVPMVGTSSQSVDVKMELPKKPKRALVNARGEVLARE